MRYIDKMQFTPATINPKEYEFLVEYVKRYSIKSVLEFGPGVSTYAFLENDCQIVALEHTDWFFEHFIKQFEAQQLSVRVGRYRNAPEVNPSMVITQCDMAFIDSPPGIPGAAHKPFNRLNTCLFASRYTRRILLHDSSRIGERLTQMLFDQMGWRVIDVCLDGYGICEMTHD